MKKMLKKWARTGTETRDDIYDKLSGAGSGARKMAKKAVEKVTPKKGRKKYKSSRQKSEEVAAGLLVAGSSALLGAQIYGKATGEERAKKASKERRKKSETKAFKEKLKDYNKYEKEVKNRKGTEKNIHDRYIDPKRIAAARKKAKEMGIDMKSLYGDMLE